jgi:monovalent cation/proton antiporter MnhG/PhaG subunit
VYAGVTVMVLSALAAAALPEVFERLHLLTATTSLGAPLIGAGLVTVRGWSEASAMIVLINVAVVVTAPVMSAATARLAAQRVGLIDEDLDKGQGEDAP